MPNVGKQNMTEAEARAALIAARDTARKTGQPQTLEGNGAAVTAEPFVNRYGATVRVIYRVGMRISEERDRWFRHRDR
ncbi:MAG: hypothetical protein JWQ73_857 [Variovorax sp.]|nr:hypothetical protein [Variovorax sp.]